MSKNYFYYEESPVKIGRYFIKPNFNMLPLKSTRGSYAIIQARLMNLSYAQYLRMCRDIYGAEIIGKNSKYPIAYFKKDNLSNSLIQDLNKRAELALKDRSML